jgi:ligand-binding SRPBCC domain-containing protein
MAIYKFYSEQFLPVPIKSAWDFFSSPNNLAKITPPELDFKVITKLMSNEIYPGMEIDYIVKPVLGIPLKWKTLISDVKVNHQFTDHQLRGPYKSWDHTHTFIEKDGGVLMTDEVHYTLPLGFLGNLAHSIFVKQKIRNIFSYRKEVLEKIFKSNGKLDN